VNPVELNTKRREADHAELERAKAEGDWGAAFDVLQANLYEIEALLIRSLSKHDDNHKSIADLRLLLESTLARVGELMLEVEKPERYRPTRASASNLDAQALGASIEALATQLSNNQAAILSHIEGIEARVSKLDAELGRTPDPTKSDKGSGMRLVVWQLQSKTLAVKIGMGGLLVGVASGGGIELVKHLLHLL
jgi:hypothetical protein